MIGDFAYSTIFRSLLFGSIFSEMTFIFESAVLSFGTFNVTSNVALIFGSSQHGKQRLASLQNQQFSLSHLPVGSN